MSIFSRLQNRVLGWRHDIPLPALETNTSPIYQPWYQFDTTYNEWFPLDKPDEPTQESRTSAAPTPAQDSKLVLATWNVDAGAPESASRISAIISHLQSTPSPVDVIFFQEVSRTALSTLLGTAWVRENWYSSEADTTNWGVQPFATMTLVSRSKLGNKIDGGTNNATLGPIWRVKYPSRFERDALCCDIFLPSVGTGVGTRSPCRVRLINVHLDSLPINPSKRPVQLSIVASYLRAAGCGLVAGDFNPVLPEDDALVGANGLQDVWRELRPDEEGFTWGADRVQRFPANRLDKVAVVGLRGYGIEVMRPGKCASMRSRGEQQDMLGKEYEEGDDGGMVWWSDHSGVLCSLWLES